jgi:hypothetical protein
MDKTEHNLEFLMNPDNQLQVPSAPDTLLSSRMDSQRNGSSDTFVDILP